jgi:hypothetical protein
MDELGKAFETILTIPALKLAWLREMLYGSRIAMLIVTDELYALDLFPDLHTWLGISLREVCRSGKETVALRSKPGRIGLRDATLSGVTLVR